MDNLPHPATALDELFEGLQTPPMGPQRLLALGHWLRSTETLAAKAEMTSAGALAFCAGRALGRNGFNTYNYAIAIAGLASVCSQYNVIPKSMLPAIESIQSGTFMAFGALVAAASLAKAGSFARIGFGSFKQAKARGAGPIEAARSFCAHLGVQAQSKIPNHLAWSAVAFAGLSWFASKANMVQASAKLHGRAASLSKRSDDFLEWRAGKALQAVLIRPQEERTALAYREAARLLCAHRLGHFKHGANISDALAEILIQAGMGAPAQPAARTEAEQALFDDLAIGFDKAFKVDPPSAPKARVHAGSKASSTSFDAQVHAILLDARLAQAHPDWRPNSELPNLAEVLALLADRARAPRGIQWGIVGALSGKPPQNGIAELFAPWRAALEAQAIRQATGQPKTSGPAGSEQAQQPASARASRRI